MRVYRQKCSDAWNYESQLLGKRIHRSTGETNEHHARKIANAVHTDMLRSQTDSLERKPPPTPQQFRGDFLTQVESEKSDTPKSVDFYTYCFDSLLR